MQLYTLCAECRICKDSRLREVLDIGTQSLTSIFPRVDEESPPSAPQVLVKCENCELVQIKHTVHASHLYTDNYGYRSGLNASMTNHLAELVKYIERKVIMAHGDLVIDIGANDATLLSKYTNNFVKLAIDPSGKQFIQYYPSDVILVPKFFEKDVVPKSLGKAKVVTSISMFYDLPDPQKFADDVASVLHEDGIWVMEQSYLPTMIARNSFDTICHEHLEYYTLKQIEFIAARAHLKVLDMNLNDCNGGSFRVVLAHKNSSHTPNYENLTYFREKEAANPISFESFEKAIRLQRRALLAFMKNKNIALCGASTKGNTLLQYYGITKEMISCASERNPRKWGHKTPGSEIPIVSEEDARNTRPDYMLVLPWHFKDEIVKREAESGFKGSMIFPLPELTITKPQNTKVAVVIGGTGQIGRYLVSLLREKEYLVYVISRSDSNDKYHIQCDVTEYELLSTIIKAVQPDEIYNLAGITDSNISMKEPINTLNVNTTSVFHILELIKGTNIKLFQAGSIEMFKGNTETFINEESIIRPITPYGISKANAFWAVDMYRKFCGVNAITGILTNIESQHRKETYVTKKIINYFKEGKYDQPLKIGNINGRCDWMYVEDAVEAIHHIMQQNECSDYIIGTGKINTVADLLFIAAKHVGLDPYWLDNTPVLYDEISGKEVVIANNQNLFRNFETETNFYFNNSKLLKTGFKLKYNNISDIVRKLMDI